MCCADLEGIQRFPDNVSASSERVIARYMLPFIGFDRCSLLQFALAFKTFAACVKGYLDAIERQIPNLGAKRHIAAAWQKAIALRQDQHKPFVPHFAPFFEMLSPGKAPQYRNFKAIFCAQREQLNDSEASGVRGQLLMTINDVMEGKILDEYVDARGYETDWQGLERDIPTWLWQKPTFMLAAVKQCPAVLRFAGAELQADRTFIFEAVRLRGAALAYVTQFQDDPAISAAGVSSDPRFLKYAPQCLKANKNIVLSAVSWLGLLLEYSDRTLQNDEAIVCKAVQQDGRALQHASPELQDDEEVVQEAMKPFKCSLRFASLRLQQLLDAAD